MLDIGIPSDVLNQSFALSPQVLWIGFAIVCAVAGIMTLVLVYHWYSYGDGLVRRGVATLVYLAGIILLLGFIFAAISGYIVSTLTI